MARVTLMLLVGCDLMADPDTQRDRGAVSGLKVTGVEHQPAIPCAKHSTDGRLQLGDGAEVQFPHQRDHDRAMNVRQHLERLPGAAGRPYDIQQVAAVAFPIDGSSYRWLNHVRHRTKAVSGSTFAV